MFASAFLLLTLLPLELSPSGNYAHLIGSSWLVGSVVDGVKILGLPRLHLRDSNGKLYIANQSLMHESAFILNREAGVLMISNQARRKAYINSYVRR